MQTAEIRKLPLSMPVKVGFLTFAAVLLVLSWYLVEVTWTNVGAAVAFAAVLATIVFPVRRDKLMSEATQKIVRHHVRRRGRPMTIEMAGTPKYEDRSLVPSYAGRFISLAVAALLYVVIAVWPESLEFLRAQGWILLGLALYTAFLAVYSLLLAPKDFVRIDPDTRDV